MGNLKRKFDYSHATVHLIDTSTITGDLALDQDDYADEALQLRRLKLLRTYFPFVVGKLRNGDIIEDVSESGYRSQGIVMYYKKNKTEKLINARSNVDDYGAPSMKFELFDFPGGYWDKMYSDTKHKLNINFDVANPLESKFYWRADHGYAIMKSKSFVNSKRIIRKDRIAHKSTIWWLVHRENRTYMVSDKIKNDAEKNEDSFGYCAGWSSRHKAYVICNEYI